MAKENREIKSGVFADLFGDDEKDGKRNFLSLYNALHGTDLKLENTVIEAKKIPQAVIKTFYNDVSYREKLFKIPTPEFYVFYNGEKKAERECIMKLSDAFHDFQSDPACELKVKFENIRGKAGANLPVVRNCVIMKQYCDFMEIIFRYQAELNSQSTGEERQTILPARARRLEICSLENMITIWTCR